MTSSQLAPARPTTIVVNGRSASPGALERCVERLLRTTPAGTTVVVFTPRSVRLPPTLARRVQTARGGQDDYLARVRSEVAQDRAVVVLPASSTPAESSWLETAHARMGEQPRLIGVLGPEGGELFAFPREVTDVDGPQCVWSPLLGLNIREALEEGATAGRPCTLSAVLIVKDEEEALEACLRAVIPFVDEVVVYDTGSGDRTLDIARSLAGTVVEGHWDNDFGAARNRALAHATGDWVLSIDADEVAEGDPAALRQLINSSTADAFIVSVISTDHGRGAAGQMTRGTRLFRRAGAEWRGALHEQITFDGGGRCARISAEDLPPPFIHSGYSAVTMAEKDKRARNVEISRTVFEAAPEGTTTRADGAAHYGRSLAGAGEIDEALRVLDTLLVHPASPGNVVQAARIAVPEHLRRRHWQILEAWLTLTERCGESTDQVAVWRAGALVGRDELDGAAALLDGLLEGSSLSADLWGHPFDRSTAVTLRSELDLLQGAPDRAAARMRTVLQQSPETVNLQVLVNALGALGLTMRDLIDEAPEAFLERALRDMVLLAPHVSLHWFSAHSAARPGDFRPIVAGNAVAARCGWLDALEWSTRARETDLVGVCAMRDLAEDDGRDVLERALCWGFLAEGFGEPDALPHLVSLLAPLAEDQARQVRQELGRHLPDLELPTAVAHDRTPA